MKAIISRGTATGLPAEVGTSDRTVVSHYKTQDGVVRFAKKSAQGKPWRIEFFHDDQFYGQPYHRISSIDQSIR